MSVTDASAVPEQLRRWRFQKGHKRVGGRQKGSRTKMTVAIERLVEGALMRNGGEAWLAAAAEREPAAFMGLLGKLIRRDVQVDIGPTLEALISASWQVRGALRDASASDAPMLDVPAVATRVLADAAVAEVAAEIEDDDEADESPEHGVHDDQSPA